MERWRDGGAEGQKEQVVRLKGLMSNERLSRPQLILSLYLYGGISHSTKLITPPPSIILLSTVIHWKLLNSMLQICPPFNNSVICCISCRKHTTLFCRTLFEDYCGWHLWDTARIWSNIFLGIKWYYPDLSVIAKSTTSHPRL